MEETNKLFSDNISCKLSEDISVKVSHELVGDIKECNECMTDIETVQQTVRLIRTGDFEQFMPQNISKRLFDVLKLKQ